MQIYSVFLALMLAFGLMGATTVAPYTANASSAIVTELSKSDDTTVAELTEVADTAVDQPLIAPDYTNPTGGYSFATPEGWQTIDSTNVDAISEEGIANGTWDALMSTSAAQTKTMPMVILYPLEMKKGAFNANMNVISQEMGVAATVADLMPLGTTFDAQYKAMLPEWTLTTPLTAVDMQGREVGILEGTYVANETTLTLRQVFVISGTTLLTVSETAPTAEIDSLDAALETLVTTLTK